eukprot:PhF_6_TR3722/c0_g1_i2/m.5329
MTLRNCMTEFGQIEFTPPSLETTATSNHITKKYTTLVHSLCDQLATESTTNCPYRTTTVNMRYKSKCLRQLMAALNRRSNEVVKFLEPYECISVDDTEIVCWMRQSALLKNAVERSREILRNIVLPGKLAEATSREKECVRESSHQHQPVPPLTARPPSAPRTTTVAAAAVPFSARGFSRHSAYLKQGEGHTCWESTAASTPRPYLGSGYAAKENVRHSWGSEGICQVTRDSPYQEGWERA